MIDFIGEIKKIEKQIESVTGDLADQVVEELQAAKNRLKEKCSV